MPLPLKCLVGLVMAVAPLAADPSLESPFSSGAGATGSSAPVAAAAGAVEFVGVLRTGAEEVVCLYDTTKQRGYWLAVGQTEGGVALKSYDAAKRQATVELQGQAQTLALKEPKFEGTVTPVAPPPPGLTVAAAAPSPADEAARLQAVAEEVKRRRALRQAAAQQAGGPPPVPPPGVPMPPRNGAGGPGPGR